MFYCSPQLPPNTVEPPLIPNPTYQDGKASLTDALWGDELERRELSRGDLGVHGPQHYDVFKGCL